MMPKGHVMTPMVSDKVETTTGCMHTNLLFLSTGYWLAC